MVPSSSERMARIHELEIKHQDGIHQSNLIHRDEDARRLRLHILYARDENALLNDRSNEKNIQYRQLSKQYDKVRLQLGDAKGTIHDQNTRLKKQSIEIDRLKAEVESFGDSLQDSGKVLQEKFTLVRELDRLRPELEHLQSQLSGHQAVIAEKHRLQRQLDSLEVELENEKRSRQRAHDKENKNVTTEVKSRAEDAEKRLASERRERDKMSKAHETALSEATNRSDRLQEQVFTMKEKFKELQAELENAKGEVEQHHLVTEKETTTEHKPKRAAPAKKQARRKQKDEESILEQSAIHTPSNEHQADRRPYRKRAGEQAPLGQKSSFSVTPFLNRNKDMSNRSRGSSSTELPPVPGSESDPESESGQPAEAPKPLEQLDEPNPTLSPAKASASSKPNPHKARGRSRTKPLADAPSSKRNASNQPEQPPVEPHPDQGAEDGSSIADKENAPAPKAGKASQDKTNPTLHPSIDLGPHVVGNANGKKKRRKLLGGANTTIFDDDDGEAVSSATTGPVGQAGKRKRAPLSGASNAFSGANFSPLKRDRRGAGASFLA